VNTMPEYDLFLTQAQRYVHDLEAHLQELGLAAPVFLQTRLEDTQRIIQATQHAIDGSLSAEHWDKAVRLFLLWSMESIENIVNNGLSSHFDALSQEPVLTLAAWQHLLDADPWRARRRYCHQVWLARNDLSHQLQLSVTAFQSCTQRQPDRFRAHAARQIQRWLSASEPDTSDVVLQQVWEQMSSTPYPPATPYADFAGPSALLRHVRDDCELTMAIRLMTRSSPKQSSSPLAKLRALLRSVRSRPAGTEPDDAEPLHDMLAVVWEEAQIADPPRRIRESAARSSLTPYPDEGMWQHWLATNETAARQRFAQLLLVEVHIGAFAPFNLGESIAVFRSLIA
jgi:hypothetical protein